MFDSSPSPVAWSVFIDHNIFINLVGYLLLHLIDALSHMTGCVCRILLRLFEVWLEFLDQPQQQQRPETIKHPNEQHLMSVFRPKCIKTIFYMYIHFISSRMLSIFANVMYSFFLWGAFLFRLGKHVNRYGDKNIQLSFRSTYHIYYSARNWWI